MIEVKGLEELQTKLKSLQNIDKKNQAANANTRQHLTKRNRSQF